MITRSQIFFSRQLTARQKELLLEYAQLEDIRDGTVDGVQQGQDFSTCGSELVYIFLWPGSGEGGRAVTRHKEQQPVKHEEKNFLQKLKEVFWKPSEDEEPEVKEQHQKMS